MIPPKHDFKLSYTQLPYKWHNTTPITRNTLAGGNNTIKGKKHFYTFFSTNKVGFGAILWYNISAQGKTISHGLITPNLTQPITAIGDKGDKRLIKSQAQKN